MLTTAFYRATVIARWIARITGTLVALIFLASREGGARMNLEHGIFLVSMAMLLLGLLLAWKWQLLGGLVPLGGFVLLVSIEGRRPPGVSGLYLWPVAVGVLNLLCWWILRARVPADVVAWAEAWQSRLTTALNGNSALYRAAVVGRWVGRIAGTLVALFYLSFVVGEGPPPLFRLGLQQDLVFFATATLFVGLILAWKWELLGGLIPLAGFVLLFLVGYARLLMNRPYVLPAAIAGLNVLCWWRLKAGPPAGGAEWRVPKQVLAVVGVCVTAFAALCANEFFGNPPLMTPSFRPPAAMAGEWRKVPMGAPVARVPADPDWRALNVVFTIHPDGSVTGQVGDAAVLSDRMAYNRSWFGKLMNWRLAYAVHGKLDHAVQESGRFVFAGQFTAPLTMQGRYLSGALYFKRRILHVALVKELATDERR